MIRIIDGEEYKIEKLLIPNKTGYEFKVTHFFAEKGSKIPTQEAIFAVHLKEGDIEKGYDSNLLDLQDIAIRRLKSAKEEYLNKPYKEANAF